MTKLITSQADKAEAFTLLKAAIQITILHGVKHDIQQKIFQHIAWLEANLTEFTIDARLDSNELQTKLTLVYNHGVGHVGTN